MYWTFWFADAAAAFERRVVIGEYFAHKFSRKGVRHVLIAVTRSGGSSSFLHMKSIISVTTDPEDVKAIVD